MKNIIYGLILIITFSSCSLQQSILFPVDSKRKDAVFSLIVPDNNYGSIEDIHIYSWTQGGILNVNRVLMDFDFTGIPKGTKIKKAYLDLYYNENSRYNKNGGNKGEDDFIIQRVISDWHEQNVTWNLQPKTTIENQILVKRKKSLNADYTKMDITKLVQDILDSEEDKRFGILIRLLHEQPYNIILFASSDHPNKELRPKLTLSYKKK